MKRSSERALAAGAAPAEAAPAPAVRSAIGLPSVIAKPAAVDKKREKFNEEFKALTSAPAPAAPAAAAPAAAAAVVVDQAEMHKRELASFLEEQQINPSDNALRWWKSHEKKYPNVAAVAKCLLAVQAAAVSVERFWSRCGVTVVNRRARLAPSSVELLAYLNHNFELVFH
jgi:hypothetical protein